MKFIKKISLFTKIVLILILLSSGFALFKSLKHSPPTKVKPLPQDSAVQIYFNHNQASSYKDPYRHFTRKGDNLEQQIVDAIEGANSSVDIAVMEFRLPKVSEALKNAHNRGVRVRVIIDNKYNKTLAEYTNLEITRMNSHDKLAYEQLKQYPADALAMLRQSGIEIKDDTSNGATKGSGLMHHKFVVVDGKTTIISSGNLTSSDMHGDFGNLDSQGNANNMVVIPNNPELSRAFTNEFDYMWQGLFKSHKPKRNPVTIGAGNGIITINFSPSSRKDDITLTSNGVIASYVQQAQKSVHVALFVFSAQNISDTLGSVHDKGVEDIKVLIDPDFFRQSYSKAYDAMGVCPRPGKKNSRIKVKPWKKPITTVGFPSSARGDRAVHSKMAVVDGVLVITGSHNWSDAGNYSNDETLIAIQNPIVAAHYEREFNRLYETAQLGLKTIPHAQKCSYSRHA